MDALTPAPVSSPRGKKHSSKSGNPGRRPSIDTIQTPGVDYELGQEVWYDDGKNDWTEASIIHLQGSKVTLELANSRQTVAGVSKSCIAPIEFDTDDELFNLLSEFGLESHYDSVLAITAGTATHAALARVSVKDLQWALKAPAGDAHKLLAAAKQCAAFAAANERAAKDVEAAAIRGNLGMKI